jgi:hypothetical protein
MALTSHGNSRKQSWIEDQPCPSECRVIRAWIRRTRQHSDQLSKSARLENPSAVWPPYLRVPDWTPWLSRVSHPPLASHHWPNKNECTLKHLSVLPDVLSSRGNADSDPPHPLLKKTNQGWFVNTTPNALNCPKQYIWSAEHSSAWDFCHIREQKWVVRG